MSTIHLIGFRSKFRSINWIFNAKSIDFITFFFKYFINHELYFEYFINRDLHQTVDYNENVVGTLL